MERVVQDIAQLQIIGLIVSCSLELMVVRGESVATLIAEIAGVPNDGIKHPPTEFVFDSGEAVLGLRAGEVGGV